MYNSAGEFSTFVENFFREGRLFGRVVGGLRPPPPLTGQRRGLRPLLGPGRGALLGTGKGDGGVFSPVALASAIIDFYFNNKTLCSYFLIEQSTSIKSKRRAVHSNFLNLTDNSLHLTSITFTGTF